MALRYHVVCDNFVSVGFDDEADAKMHAHLIKDKGCRLQHRVIYGDFRYGSKWVGKEKP